MCNKKCGGFHEALLDSNGAELMVDICVTCGRITDLYTYARDAKHVEYFNEKKDDFVPIAENWKSDINPLFVHCPKAKIAWTAKKLLSDELSDATFHIDEERIEEEHGIINRMVSRYKIKRMVPIYES